MEAKIVINFVSATRKPQVVLKDNIQRFIEFSACLRLLNKQLTVKSFLIPASKIWLKILILI
jgi:hypothetical protein